MGHHHASHADALDDFHQFQLHLRAQFLVQRAHGFVEQQQLRPLGQRAGQGHALALAAGELVRLALGVLGHVHQLEHLFDAGVDFTLGQTVLLEAEGDVLGHRHVREQGIGLEHHVDRPLVGRHVGDVHAVEQDAPFGRPFEACEHAQQGGLARAGAAEQGEDLTLVDFQGHIVHGYGFVELLGDAIDLDQHLFRVRVAFKSLPVSAGGVCHVKLPTGDSSRAEATGPNRLFASPRWAGSFSAAVLAAKCCLLFSSIPICRCAGRERVRGHIQVAVESRVLLGYLGGESVSLSGSESWGRGRSPQRKGCLLPACFASA
ncbi:hypothetical protein D3C84_340350 [compost metagenome]